MVIEVERELAVPSFAHERSEANLEKARTRIGSNRRLVHLVEITSQ